MKRIMILFSLLACLLLSSCAPTFQSNSVTSAQHQSTETTAEPAGVHDVFLIVTYLEENAFAGKMQDDRDLHVYVIHSKASDILCVGDMVSFAYSDQDLHEEHRILRRSDGSTYETHYRIDRCVDGPSTIIFVPEKPVIYLYPTEETVVDVTVDFKGIFTVTIPNYQNGWRVIASPDGTLTAADGTAYPYLFWEGISTQIPQIDKGFCVTGSETAAFLCEALTGLGLNEKESADFLAYWLPRMERNPYNVISFLGAEYEAVAPITVSPSPDSLLRVFMVFYASDEAVEIPSQTLPTFVRHGFSVIEWGGCEIR